MPAVRAAETNLGVDATNAAFDASLFSFPPPLQTDFGTGIFGGINTHSSSSQPGRPSRKSNRTCASWAIRGARQPTLHSYDIYIENKDFVLQRSFFVISRTRQFVDPCIGNTVYSEKSISSGRMSEGTMQSAVSSVVRITNNSS